MYLTHRMLPLALFLTFCAAASPAQAAAGLAGHWEGKIQIPDHEMSFTVDLDQGSKGEWIGSLSIMGSSTVDVPLIKITVSGTAVQFVANLPGETLFVGTLSSDSSTVTGKASNAEGAVPFTLARTGDANVKVPPPSSILSKDFEGTWQGAIETDGMTRRVRLTLTAAPDGTARGTLVSVDKGNLEIPVTTVTLQGKQLELQARAVGGTYRGTLGVNGEIAGEWTESTVHIPLTFKRTAPEVK
jgi:hypothetical protein